jgi:hypothetical protein
VKLESLDDVEARDKYFWDLPRLGLELLSDFSPQQDKTNDSGF